MENGEIQMLFAIFHFRLINEKAGLLLNANFMGKPPFIDSERTINMAVALGFLSSQPTQYITRKAASPKITLCKLLTRFLLKTSSSLLYILSY